MEVSPWLNYKYIHITKSRSLNGYLQNEVGKYFYAERKIYSVLCKKWLKNITTHDMLFHAI